MCLTEAKVQELAAGTLPAGEIPGATEHLRTCSSCTEALNRARLLLTDAPPTRSAQVRSGAARPAKAPAGVSGPTPAPEKIGPYVLLERIGEGGMGAVYTAYHPELDRKVALKLLRPEHAAGETASDLQARLLREAQAMARLDHPNVVAVHDAGQYQNKVFLVMDLVEGVTLKSWLAEKPRSWREVLAVFLQAGRGLAAAHAAGLVHRDFKPSNVLVGRDGRVRVTDFGIARALNGPPEPASAPSPDEETLAEAALSTPITRAGAVLGTPRYMAPEQSLGQPGDPRTDQFSFCVALYEALYGETPFEKPFDPLYPQRIRDAPKSTPVPRFVRRALLRGLSITPTDRFPSMEGLLEALGSDPARRVRVALAAVAGAALLVAVVVLGARALRQPAVLGCEDPGRELAGIWDPAARSAVNGALAQAGAKGIEAIDGDLDHYAAAWSTLHQATCARAAKSRGDEGVLLELTCLARERTDLEALVGVLDHADGDIASHVGLATRSLIPPSRCADARGLAALPKPAADPKVRAQVEELRLRLASASFEAAAGKPKAAIATLQAIVQRARELRHGQLEAEALYGMSAAQSWQGDDKGAEASMHEAENLAEASGADLISAEAAAGLAYFEVYAGHSAGARQWLEEAKSKRERIGGDPYAEGLAENVESSFQDQSDDEAVRHAERAVQLFEEALGPLHPRTVMYRANLGIAYDGVGHYENAVSVLSDSLRQMSVSGAKGAQELGTISALADALMRLGRLEEAETLLLRGESTIDPAGANANGWNALLLADRAQLRDAQGRTDAALVTVRKAEQVASVAYGLESDNYGTDLAIECEILEETGKHLEGLRLSRRAESILVKADGPEASALIDLLISRASSAVALGHSKDVPPLLDRALAIAKKHRPYPGQIAALKFVYARAMFAEHDRPRAGALVGEARAELAGIPWKQRELAALDAWAKAKKLR